MCECLYCVSYACVGCSSEPAFKVLQEMLMLTFASGVKMCKSDCSQFV